MHARHIVIEGGDGSGKTTQSQLLMERLEAEGVDAEYFPEPGKAALELPIRQVMLDPEREYDDKTRLFLVNAARVETVKRINLAREAGRWAISDRSLLSSIAMQGYAEGLDLDTVRRVSEWAADGWQPDLVVVLDAPTEVLRSRSDERGTKDAFEQKPFSYHAAVVEGYRTEARRIGATVLRADQTIVEVHEDIWTHVEPFLDQT